MDSLKSLHTFSFAAYCHQAITINSVDSLIRRIKEIQQHPEINHYLMLGEGSNTVFVDDYPNFVLLNKIKGIQVDETDESYLLTVGAGENWHDLVSYCIEHGMGGFENLALIPGTVGASPIQNIGAYGVEVEQFIEKVEFLETSTSTIKTLLKHECEFGYRDSIFKRQATNSRIITRVFYKLPKHYELVTHYGPLVNLVSPSIKDIYNMVVYVRKSKLPDVKQLGNAGSFYKNPIISKQHFTELQVKYSDIVCFPVNVEYVKVPAAWLIDKLGFKGKSIGQIGCHVNQPLVLVNLGEGEAQDLLTLAREIKDTVFNVFNIQLENEVRLIGKEGLVSL